MAQISSNKCNTCEKDNAGLFCYECKYYLCAPCRLLHDKFLKKHTVTESYKIDRSVFASTFKCETHDLEYAHFCKDCNYLTCSNCITSGHKGHDFTDVSEVAGCIRDALNQVNCDVKAKLNTLTRLIDEIENVKMKNLKEENNHFVGKAREIAHDLVQVIELVTEQNVNHASDFLVLEQQNIRFELASLKKLQLECRSVMDRIEQVIIIEHDMTFYVQQKSLTKDFLDTDSIPIIIDPNKMGEFQNEDFIDQVVETIQSKYGIRCFSKNVDEIVKLKQDIDEARSSISKVKAIKNAEMEKIVKQMSQMNTELQNERERTSELEEEKKNIHRMREKSEDALKQDNEDAKNKIKSLADDNRKQIEDINRLKYQIEVMSSQMSMIPPTSLIGLRVFQKTFKDMHILIAIEIGTSYSGCCFSVRGQYADSGTSRISSPQYFNEDSFKTKIPTAVLLNYNKEIRYIGDEAVSRYSVLKQEDDHHNWFFFTQFKNMLSRSENKNSEIQMKTTDGTKELPAVFIYSIIIKFFKDLMQAQMKSRNLFEYRIGWIITIPPSATVEVQQLMIKAAMEAGISEQLLLILSETDATLAVCRCESSMTCVDSSFKVLILDLGCGSFDISVCEMLEKQPLKTLLNSSFPAVGWQNIKEAFEEIILDIVGNDIFQRFCNEHKEERNEWLDNFYHKVCSADGCLREYIVVQIPLVLQTLIQNETGAFLDDVIRSSKYSDSLKCQIQDRLKIKRNVWNQLFDIPVQTITYHVKRVTEMEGFESLSNLIITGGIVQSKTMQEQLKQIFIDKNVIIPNYPETTVLKGAIDIGMSVNNQGFCNFMV